MFEHPLPTPIEYNLPTLSPTGSYKGRLDLKDHQSLRTFHRTHQSQTRMESVPNFITEKSSKILELPAEMRRQLHMTFMPICSEWIGNQYALVPTYVYGLRTYLNGSQLKVHRDRQNTHIVSAIIQVDQDVDVDWPLYLENNEKEWDKVILKPGDYVLYEGCRLEHGRPEPLKGREYRNVFVHFALGRKLK
jgi:prolyl 4-hydroxylase